MIRDNSYLFIESWLVYALNSTPKFTWTFFKMLSLDKLLTAFHSASVPAKLIVSNIVK